jgi:hypothetical protein
MNHTRPSGFLRAFSQMSITLAIAAILCGCETQKMALDSHKGSIANLPKPIGIFTLRTENAYKPNYQPSVRILQFVPIGSKDDLIFKPNKPYKEQKKEYYEYLVSVDLDAGAYTLREVEGGSGDGFFVSGSFKFPVNAQFTLPPGSVSYLGHITMINRMRKEGEKRSGSVIPLIDQAVCGFSGGTFDVAISDRSEEDIPAFVKAYPSLNDVKINTSMMHK